jgi:hypothetical protein
MTWLRSFPPNRQDSFVCSESVADVAPCCNIHTTPPPTEIRAALWDSHPNTIGFSKSSANQALNRLCSFARPCTGRVASVAVTMHSVPAPFIATTAMQHHERLGIASRQSANNLFAIEVR